MRPQLSQAFLSLCILVLILLAPSCRGDSGSPAGAKEIGPGGGVVAVTAGNLAGTILSVPPGAFDRSYYVKVAEATPPEIDGFEILGPGTNFSPTGVAMDIDAAATLVFDPDLLTEMESAGEIMVIRQTSQGRRIHLTPRTVDADAGLVVVDIDLMATYWVARQSQTIGFILAEYLPLHNGDRYVYDNDMALLVNNTLSEPNLEGRLVSTLSFVRDGSGFGFYLTRQFAETFFLGNFDVTGAFQEVADSPLLFLGSTGVVGSSYTDLGSLLIFSPTASTQPLERITVRTAVTIESSGSLPTVLGRFSDVLEIAVRIEREDRDGNITETMDRFWLARDVGPVQLRLDGVVDGIGSLVDGLVGGLPVLPW